MFAYTSALGTVSCLTKVLLFSFVAWFVSIQHKIVRCENDMALIILRVHRGSRELPVCLHENRVLILTNPFSCSSSTLGSHFETELKLPLVV